MGKAVRSFEYCFRCKDTREQIEASGRFLYGNGYCNTCGAKWAAANRAKRPEEVKSQHREFHYRHKDKRKLAVRVRCRRLKVQAITAYGGRCACCGETTLEFLAIDHINGGGKKHLREIRVSSGAGFYRWLRDQGYPEEFRILCMNCNQSLGMFGYCPHQRERIEDAEETRAMLPL